MIVGVTKGYSKKLRLVGVGYRALPDKEKIIFTDPCH
jgi:ribosomal protein L6P/L9E